jgi:hypothetical protein
MDFEDLIAGEIPTRFSYTKVGDVNMFECIQRMIQIYQVPASDFGYTPKEILDLPEEVLRQRVSLKKIAPYREREFKPPPRNKKLEKKKAWEAKSKTMQSKKRKRGERNGGEEKGWDEVIGQLFEKEKEKSVDEVVERNEGGKNEREGEGSRKMKEGKGDSSRRKEKKKESAESARGEMGDTLQPQKKKRKRTRKHKAKEENKTTEG